MGRRRALTCAIHNSILDKCLSSLEETGFFWKETILNELGIGSHVGKSICWNSIRAQIEEVHGCRIIPLSKSFMKDKKRHSSINNSPDGKALAKSWLATGRGASTKGYASYQFNGYGILAIKKLEIQEKVAIGTSNSIKKFVKELNRKGISHQEFEKLEYLNEYEDRYQPF